MDKYLITLINSENGKQAYDDFSDLEQWRLRYANTPESLNTILKAWWYFRQYKVLPSAGGYLDQDKLLMDDFRTLDRLYDYHNRVYTMQTS